MWYGLAASLFTVYEDRIVFTIDKIVLFLFLLAYFIIHVLFFMWLRSAYMIRNAIANREEEFWLDEHTRGTHAKHSAAHDDEAATSASSFNTSNQISPSLMQNLDMQKLNSQGNFLQLSLKRESVFGTINNIDRINFYQKRVRKQSLADNFKFLFNGKSKKNNNSNSTIDPNA